jgi:hypothetical protein
VKRILIAVLALVLVAGHASAGGRSRSGPVVVPTATVSPRSATPIPACAKLQPIVGSVQRTGSRTHPINHTAKYSYGVYNPISGQFGTATFRR